MTSPDDSVDWSDDESPVWALETLMRDADEAKDGEHRVIYTATGTIVRQLETFNGMLCMRAVGLYMRQIDERLARLEERSRDLQNK